MPLFENFNTTNQTSPHFERHESFVSNVLRIPCSLILILPPNERCAYVEEYPEECKTANFLFDYMHLYYCVIRFPWEPLTTFIGILVLVFVIMILFMILYNSADNFFCPSLQSLSNLLGLNENVAGVTLLAFGNAAPDAFTSFASLIFEERVIYSDVFASMCFVYMFVGGAIVVSMPFNIRPSIFLRDIGFLLLTVLYLGEILGTKKKVSLIQAISILSIYIIYIIAVIVDQYLAKYVAKKVDERMEKLNTFNISEKTQLDDLLTDVGLNDKALPKSEESGDEPPQYSFLGQFFLTISPFKIDDWKSSHCFSRLIMIISIPIILPLKIFIPVVNDELPLIGWSRLLNSIQTIILPTLFTYIIFSPYYLYVLAATSPFGILLFIFTKTNTVPYFFSFYSILGVFGSIFVIYSVAQEIISVLAVIGYSSQCSNSFLGCTLLAWGNSIGDLITNTTMARYGYPKMAFAACFGGPLIASLVCIGGTTTARILATGAPCEIAKGLFGENSEVFLVLCLIFSILALTTTNFHMRRCSFTHMEQITV
ncbi:putative sodium/calcium exchanger 7 isoform X2 [Teleopsis dalmanni]|uniref:putative sodium/calcium exchanger 7 isoform X2 n=1 Tax=Teleopsis dalmanni TaxID=139649 RepID=UPI0018CDCB61|nr:putative sodium/calcium exchanger 7 isoform X2 [Teleopsis dalmanni]